MKKIPIFIILFFSRLLTNIGFAENGNSDIEKLNIKIIELQQQIIEMQKKHDAEIDALKQQVNELAGQTGKPQAKDELAALRELAKAKATEELIAEKELEETTFKSRSLGLQALNPEISVTGDFLFSTGQDSTSDQSSDFNFRNLGLHLESWLDPYTRFKGAVEFHEDETELGEAYVTLYNFSDDLNLTFGKFRQQFGVVNRWHKHGLDQVDFPLAFW